MGMNARSLLGLLLLTGCASAPPFDAGQMLREWEGFMNQDHVLVPGDLLSVTVYQFPELAQKVIVSPEGTVTMMRLAQPVKAVGRKVSEFRKACEDAYAQVMPASEVSINLDTPNQKSVYVAGEVRNAAAVPWSSSLTAARAISAAGGFLITAKDSDVFVVRAEPGSRKPRMIRIDVDEILHGKQPDFVLLPGDIVWCQTSSIADVGNWVELYIRRMLPFSIGGPALGTIK